MGVIIQIAGILTIFWIFFTRVELVTSEDIESNGVKYDHGKVMMCYWGTWAHYRASPDNQGMFNYHHINPSLCTHLIYSFAGLHMASNKINSLDPWLDFAPGEIEENPENPEANQGGLALLRNTTQELRDGPSGNPDLKILIAIGGWNQESERFSLMARSASHRDTFVASIIAFIIKHDLDGVDMDWEYPTQRGGVPEDKQNFPIFLKELREALDVASGTLGRQLDLTSAFGCGKKIIDEAYDVPEIAKYYLQ